MEKINSWSIFIFSINSRQQAIQSGFFKHPKQAHFSKLKTDSLDHYKILFSMIDHLIKPFLMQSSSMSAGSKGEEYVVHFRDKTHY